MPYRPLHADTVMGEYGAKKKTFQRRWYFRWVTRAETGEQYRHGENSNTKGVTAPTWRTVAQSLRLEHSTGPGGRRGEEAEETDKMWDVLDKEEKILGSEDAKCGIKNMSLKEGLSLALERWENVPTPKHTSFITISQCKNCSESHEGNTGHSQPVRKTQQKLITKTSSQNVPNDKKYPYQARPQGNTVASI